MTGWPLAVLQGLRAAQARGAVRGADALRAEAVRARSEADEVARRAGELRKSLTTRGTPHASGLAGELLCGAASRTEIDRAARQAERDRQRAAAEADRDGRRAAEAAAAARDSWGRAEALARGMEHWEELRRRAREARLEREVEDAWNGTDGI